MNMISLYNLLNYSDWSKDEKISKIRSLNNNLEDTVKLLEDDKNYHIRLEGEDKNVIFFQDLDGLDDELDNYFKCLIDFFKKYLNMEFNKPYEYLNKNLIKYTQNDVKNNSYHISIPSFNCLNGNLKILTEYFTKIYPQYKKNKKGENLIDIGLYSVKFFRMPNQKKGGNVSGIHRIINGEMKDFIVCNIPNEKTYNIDELLLNLPTLFKESKIIKTINPNNNHIDNIPITLFFCTKDLIIKNLLFLKFILFHM